MVTRASNKHETSTKIPTCAVVSIQLSSWGSKTLSKWVAKPFNGSELAHGHVILLLDFSFFFYLYNLNFINFYVSWITNTSHKFHNHKQDTTTKHKLQSWPKPRIHYLISHLQISNAHLNSFSLKRQKKKKKDHFGLNPICFFIISKQMLYFYNFFFKDSDGKCIMMII